MTLSETDRRVNALLIRFARDAYVDQDDEVVLIPIDRRCPGCGVERDGCDRPLCSRYLSDGEA